MTEADLLQRLEKLERDNRRLKRMGAAALVLAAALAVMAATRPVPDVIKAHEFDVVDSSGKVRLKMENPKGQPLIEMKDPQGASVLKLGFDNADGPSLTLRLPPWDYDWKDVKPRKGQVVRENALHIGISPDSGPIITLADSAGLRMDLGSTSTVTQATGATQQTSAASIVMFSNDKKHHMIWCAPPGGNDPLGLFGPPTCTGGIPLSRSRDSRGRARDK